MGHLRLNGGPYNLSWPACPTLFLRKQTSRVVTWETQLSFSPTSPRTEAGTVVWWNYFTYSSLGIRLSPTDSSKRILRFRPAKGEEKTAELSTTDADVKLIVKCEELKYIFGFVEGEEGETTWIGEVSTDIMTENPPVGAPFTGMLLGLYSFGEMEPCLVPADFKYAQFSL